MEKNLLKNGKIIYPDKLKINLKLKVGIIGSGKISLEYIKVIKSFNHKIEYFFSLSNNKDVFTLAKKNNAKVLDSFSDIRKVKDVDLWIVCTSWNRMRNIFFRLSNFSKPILFEKSIIIDPKELKKIESGKNYNNIKKYFNFAYNRNYYDYILILRSILNKEKLVSGSSYFFDPYNSLNKDKKINHKHLPVYITSHWISFLLKLFKLGNYKIKKQKFITLDKNKNFKKIRFFLEKKNALINFEFFNFPNLANNHEVNLYLTNFVVKISPIEKMIINKDILKKKIKGQNTYKLKQDEYRVSQKFKPGFRLQYYDFVLNKILKQKSLLSTDIDDLVAIYKICDFLKK